MPESGARYDTMDPAHMEMTGKVQNKRHLYCPGGSQMAMHDGQKVYFEWRVRCYATLDRRRLPVGSGPVESAIRRVINLRFKGPSIFWEADTVGHLMHLRAAFKAGRWDEPIERVLTRSYPVPSFSPMARAQVVAALPDDEENNSHRPQALRGAA